MRQVAVVGVGMTKFGVSEKSELEMFSEAAMDALNESNLKPKDIQALFLGNAVGGLTEGQTIIASHAAAELGLQGIPATRFEGACASGTMAVRDAFMWVASGYYDVVLAAGTERQTVTGTAFATRIMNTGAHSFYESATGITFPGMFAMMAHMYCHKYGIPLEKLKKQMAMVAVKNHKMGVLNPKAQFRKEITIEDVFSSMMIASPLQLYDCCPISDGAAAAVITSADVAKKLTDKPAYIVGVGQGCAGGLSTQRDYTRLIARESSAQQAYQMAGLTPQDIDVCELHDCFTVAEIVATEGLGFFDFGDGGAAVERGDTQMGGKVVINPSGGLKSKGHPVGATGVAQVYEIVNQLRGSCGARQVEGTKIGITDTMGGPFASVGNIILRRGW